MRGVVQALLVTLLFAGLPSDGHGQLAHTDPKHYGSGIGGSLDSAAPGGLPDFRSYNPTPRVLMQRNRQDLRDVGPPDRRLTQACRQGRFLQVVDHRYVAKVGDRTYGAGIGGGPMLFDPLRMGQQGVVYLFVGQGTTNCRVYMMGVPGPG